MKSDAKDATFAWWHVRWMCSRFSPKRSTIAAIISLIPRMQKNVLDVQRAPQYALTAVLKCFAWSRNKQ